MNKGFSSLPDHFGQFLDRNFWTNFFQVALKQKKLACSNKKELLHSNLVPRVPPFYIRTKSRLKSRVTTVHLLQCKTNFFIRLSIKEHLSWVIYTCLDSSTLVYICLAIRLHSSTFVYIRLDSSGDSSMF